MFETLLALAVGVNRLVEAYKRASVAVPYLQEHKEARRFLTYLVSLLAGVGSIFLIDPVGQMFEGTFAEPYNRLLVTIVAGLVVGSGSNTVHFIADLVKNLQGIVGARYTAALQETAERSERYRSYINAVGTANPHP